MTWLLNDGWLILAFAFVAWCFLPLVYFAIGLWQHRERSR